MTAIPMTPTYTQLRDRMEALGHVWFTGAYNPNLIGVRSRSRVAGAFDDDLVLAYEDSGGRGRLFVYQGTTDPSETWLQKPMRGDGTAALVAAQNRGCWQVGPDMKGITAHRYRCFKQVRPMAYVRDNNRDGVLDIEAEVAAGRVHYGIIGADGHRASSTGFTSRVGLYGACCQVWAGEVDFTHALSFVTWTAARYGSRVSYTLLDAWT